VSQASQQIGAADVTTPPAAAATTTAPPAPQRATVASPPSSATSEAGAKALAQKKMNTPQRLRLLSLGVVVVGVVVGLIGTSQDLGLLDELHPAYRQIARIAQHISENYQQNVSLKALAEEAGLSLSRVERLFQKVFQHSPRQLLVQCRLAAARTLIEQDPGAKIAEIAYECGYTDHSAFSRQFKSYVGMSPTEYGQQLKKA